MPESSRPFPKRREFLVALAGLASARNLLAQPSTDKLGKTLPTRKLGRLDQRITQFTLGGFHAWKAPAHQQEALIDRAIELGVRTFDNARDYGDGASEKLYGKYLTPQYRDYIYLTSKSSQKTAKAVREQLENSLRWMKTDHLDLWNIHAITTIQDVDERINAGVLDAFLKARDEGKVRHLGFTGHSSYKTHLHFLKRLRELGIELDTCLMPMSLVDPHYDSFITHVLPELKKRDYGVFAMKTMGFGSFFGKGPQEQQLKELNLSLTDSGISVEDMHHFVYSLPITSLCSGCESISQLEENVKALTSFKPLNQTAQETLLTKTESLYHRALEHYKS
ncbi:aldo/keto reductase [Roseibacillus persicicus]|uniref:aldo/keto reductase n=1 Tax=Roseibacillus persicicus TaxID=454148 RepID=UPI00280D66EC|nr:aldo/keto reductase [Roseibacillus persicicus]MDQ8188969.1 aldo/keto reductase [Roseibacillus persicicus]